MDSAPLIIGRYALHGELASGGMARVHYGSLLGAQGFSRLVAIKRLHPQFAQEEHVRAMFLDEARLAARVHHPNVVSTLDVLHHEGDLFLVMEYVHGDSLRSLEKALRRKQLHVPRKIALAVIVDVLHGLHAVHEAVAEDGAALAIVHRDVSPSNVLVGADGVARVLDFGIAHAARRLEVTRVGTIKGKLAYMAPEQLVGSPVTRRADIFSTGIVLWEMLTGRRLFLRGDDGDSVLIEKILGGVVEPPRQFVPDLSPAIEEIVMKALARDPDARYATAREMALAIEAVGPLARTSEVAQWVQETAADVLAKRAATLRGIERTSARLRTAPPVEIPVEVSDVGLEPPPTSHAVPKHLSDPRASVDKLTPSLASIPGMEGAEERSGVRGWVRRASFATAAACALLSAGFGGYALVHHAPETPSAAPATPPPPPLHASAVAPHCPAGMRMVPGGRFFMGSDDDLPLERPAHHVTLSPYCIDTYEVSTSEYKACSDNGDCKRPGTSNKWPDIGDAERATYDPLCNARDPNNRGKHPINCVDWSMADGYCRAHGKRLPTEAEWEFAARGSDGRKYPWGEAEPGPKLLNACGAECIAWAKKARVDDLRAMFAGDDGFPTTAPVGSFPAGASPYGVEDMVGNVWEWVGDWFGDYGTAELIDPRGPAVGDEKVIRGGAWNGSYPAWVRPTFRYKDVPQKRSYGIGFRCARSL